MSDCFEKRLQFKNKGTVSSILVLIVLLAALVFVFGCEDKKEEAKPRKEKKTEEAKKVEASDSLKAKATEMVETYGCVFKDGKSLEMTEQSRSLPEGVISSVVTGEPGSQTLFLAYSNEDWDKDFNTVKTAVFKDRDGKVDRIGTAKLNGIEDDRGYVAEPCESCNVYVTSKDGKEFLITEEAEFYETDEPPLETRASTVSVYEIGSDSLKKRLKVEIRPAECELAPSLYYFIVDGKPLASNVDVRMVWSDYTATDKNLDSSDIAKVHKECSDEVKKELSKYGVKGDALDKNGMPLLDAGGDLRIAGTRLLTYEEMPENIREEYDGEESVVKCTSGGRITEDYKKIEKEAKVEKSGKGMYAAYKKVLVDHKRDILAYKTNMYEEHMPLAKPVAFCDIDGNGSEELLVMGDFNDDMNYALNLYTMKGSECKEIEYKCIGQNGKDENKKFYDVPAGAGVGYMVYTGKEPGKLFIEAYYVSADYEAYVNSEYSLDAGGTSMKLEKYLRNVCSLPGGASETEKKDEYYENGKRITTKQGQNEFRRAYAQHDKTLLYNNGADTSLWNEFKEKDARAMSYRDAVLYCNKHMEK